MTRQVIKDQIPDELPETILFASLRNSTRAKFWIRYQLISGKGMLIQMDFMFTVPHHIAFVA